MILELVNDFYSGTDYSEFNFSYTSIEFFQLT
jgi:hypothetical protein